MKWRFKVFVQKTLSHFPGGGMIYAAGQKWLGGIRSFKKEEFSKYNNRFCFQNRLRADDYKKLIEENFDIIAWKPQRRESILARIDRSQHHDDYRWLPEEDLCITSIYVAARKRLRK